MIEGPVGSDASERPENGTTTNVNSAVQIRTELHNSTYITLFRLRNTVLKTI